MTEELSPIYEQVSIEEWADNIHKMKIEELRDIVAEKKKKFDYYKGLGHKTLADNCDGLVVGSDLIILQLKLNMLLRHGRK